MSPGTGPTGSGMLDLTPGNPTRNAANWLGQRKALDFKSGLLADVEQPGVLQSLAGPGIAIGGLLSAP